MSPLVLRYSVALLGIGRREGMPTELASDAFGDRMKQRFGPPSGNGHLTAGPLARIPRSGDRHLHGVKSGRVTALTHYV